MNAFVSKSLNSTAYWEMHIGQVESNTPTVLALHYMTGDHAAMGFVFDKFPKPLRVLSLQAAYPSGHEYGGYSWYPDEDAFYDRSEAEQAPDIRTVVDQVAAFLGEFKQLYPTKIALTGMSQGGDLSLGLAAYHPELLDLVIPCAGRLSAPMRQASFNKPPSVLPAIYLKQGANDPIVSPESAREVTAWLKSVGYNASLEEYPGVGHDISPEMVKDIQALLSNL